MLYEEIRRHQSGEIGKVANQKSLTTARVVLPNQRRVVARKALSSVDLTPPAVRPRRFDGQCPSRSPSS